MRCRNCTTELWGTPALCPVCGTPTGLKPGPRRPGSAPLSPPTHTPPARQPSGSFNAADLLDPEVLADLPGAPAQPGAPTADLFRASSPQEWAETEPPDWLNSPAPTQPARQGSGQASYATGTFNAVNLFDSEVLAGFSFPGAADSPQAPPQPTLNAADLFDPEVLRGLSFPEDGQATQRPAPMSGSSSGVFRAPSSPLGPPRFSLSPLAPPAGPEAPHQSRPFRGPPPAGDAPEGDAPPVISDQIRRHRGWSIVSDPLPPITPRAKKPSQPLAPPPQGPYPPGAVPPPGARAPTRQQGRRTGRALGGFAIFLLVLVILGGAALFGLMRYQQLQALQPTPPGEGGLLPTVAPKAGYTIYSDRSLAFSLQYPTAWKEQADHDEHDPAYQGDLFSTGAYAALAVGSSLQYSSWSPLHMDTYVLSMAFTIPNVASVQLSTPTSPTIHIAGLDWTAEDCDITGTNGVVIHMTSLALLHHGRGYVIFYYSLQDQSSFYSNSYFDPMLLSFRFLN